MPSRLRLALIAGAVGLFSNTATAQSAAYISSYTWPAPTDKHGGFSGIEVSEDGMEFTVIGDKGILVTGRFMRADGLISGVDTDLYKLKDTHGKVVSKPYSDSEGLAIHPDGTMFVSFEREHRVWAYLSGKTKAAKLPRHRDFKHLKDNDGLEALAISADRTLYALPERSGKNVIEVYRYTDGNWDIPFNIPRIASYMAVGADFGPDGKFYLLERKSNSIFGFKIRIRQFEINGDKITEAKVLLETDAGTHDNLEGLAVWRDGAGDIRLTMVADNNFNVIQRTEFVEYRLQE